MKKKRRTRRKKSKVLSRWNEMKLFHLDNMSNLYRIEVNLNRWRLIDSRRQGAWFTQEEWTTMIVAWSSFYMSDLLCRYGGYIFRKWMYKYSRLDKEVQNMMFVFRGNRTSSSMSKHIDFWAFETLKSPKVVVRLPKSLDIFLKTFMRFLDISDSSVIRILIDFYIMNLPEVRDGSVKIQASDIVKEIVKADLKPFDNLFFFKSSFGRFSDKNYLGVRNREFKKFMIKLEEILFYDLSIIDSDYFYSLGRDLWTKKTITINYKK